MIFVYNGRYDESVRVMRPAVLLGRSIYDGIASGIDDNKANLLHGAYDDDDDFTVDPLVQLGGDRFDTVEKLGGNVDVPGRYPDAEASSSMDDSADDSAE